MIVLDDSLLWRALLPALLWLPTWNHSLTVFPRGLTIAKIRFSLYTIRDLYLELRLEEAALRRRLRLVEWLREEDMLDFRSALDVVDMGEMLVVVEIDDSLALIVDRASLQRVLAEALVAPALL